MAEEERNEPRKNKDKPISSTPDQFFLFSRYYYNKKPKRTLDKQSLNCVDWVPPLLFNHI